MALFASKPPEPEPSPTEVAEQEHARWLLSAVGQAHEAYQRGNVVFQAALQLATQSGVVVVMTDAFSQTNHVSPNPILNEICAQGWDLISGTAVFVPSRQDSRDKFLASGQQMAVSGQVIGYYMFRRSERVPAGHAGLAASAPREVEPLQG